MHELVLDTGVFDSVGGSGILALNIAAPLILLALAAVNILVAPCHACLVEVFAISGYKSLGSQRSGVGVSR